MASVFNSLFKRKRSVPAPFNADVSPEAQEPDRAGKKSSATSPKSQFDEKSLRRAVINLDLSAVKKILDKAPALVNCPLNDSGQTSLHLASELGSHELLSYLLSKEADPNVEDDSGLTPLHLSNSSQAFSLLVKSKNTNLQKKTGNADTILHYFARRFSLLDEEILKYLRKNGVDFNALNGVGDAALHIATSNDHYKLAGLLLENGAFHNVQNRRGETPLYIAAQSANGRMVKLLLKYSAVATIEAADGTTALDVAATDEIRELLRPETRRASKSDLGKKSVSTPTAARPINTPNRNALTVTFPSDRSDRNPFENDSDGSPPLAKSLPTRSDTVRSSSERIGSTVSTSPQRDHRSRSFSFSQSFNRLMIMDEEAKASPAPESQQRSQMKDKIEVELLDELSHLIDPDHLLEVIHKVTESRSFTWSDELDQTKIEVLQWITDFLPEEQQQPYLQFLYTNYGDKIQIEVEELKLKKRAKKKMGRMKSVSKFMMPVRKLKSYDWEIDSSELEYAEPLGSGSYGVVYRAMLNGQDVAVKKINSDQVDEDVLPTMLKEIALLSKLSHPSIIKFMGACLQENVALVMEYATNGDLKSFLKRARLDWAAKVSVARQIAEGMNYLHSQDPAIVHRDLKCQNILVTGDGRVKVSDFGLSRSMTNGAESSRLGTLNWLAPEVLRGQTFSSAADIYAMGMCMYEILMDGEPPYNNWLPLQIVRAIDEGEHPKIPADCDAGYAAIMEKCWAEKPEQRPTFQEVVSMLSVEEKRLVMMKRTSSSSLVEIKSPRRSRAGSDLESKYVSPGTSPRSSNTSPRLGSSSPRSGSFDGKNSISMVDSVNKKKRSSDKEKRNERKLSEKSIDVTVSSPDSLRKRGSSEKLVSFGN